MVMASVLLPVPVGLVAERVVLVVPVSDGVPEMRPVEVLMARPTGRLVALNEVGEFEAAIW
jgi:hypothetical protein